MRKHCVCCRKMAENTPRRIYLLPCRICRSAQKDVCINWSEFQKLGSAGTPPPWGRAVGVPLETHLPCLSCQIWSYKSDSIRALIRRSAWKKIWPPCPRLSRSLRVVGTDTDRSATYDFLLTFRSNYGPISYRFRDKQWFQLNILTFPCTTVYFAPPLKGFPFELGTGARDQKTRVMGLPGRERSLKFHLSGHDTRTWRTRATADIAFTHGVARQKLCGLFCHLHRILCPECYHMCWYYGWPVGIRIAPPIYTDVITQLTGCNISLSPVGWLHQCFSRPTESLGPALGRQ